MLQDPRNDDGKTDWREVWHRKARAESDDVIDRSGFGHTTIQPALVADEIRRALELERRSSVLEVGCGPGMIAEHLDCELVGVDYVPEFVEQFQRRVGKPAFRCEADALCFGDGSFDAAYVHSVFQYFPTHEYARRVIAELKRVTRRAILVCDIPLRSHSRAHLLYPPSFFDGWGISAGYYSPARYNARYQTGSR